jgi:hypothetical protein
MGTQSSISTWPNQQCSCPWASTACHEPLVLPQFIKCALRSSIVWVGVTEGVCLQRYITRIYATQKHSGHDQQHVQAGSIFAYVLICSSKDTVGDLLAVCFMRRQQRPIVPCNERSTLNALFYWLFVSRTSLLQALLGCCIYSSLHKTCCGMFGNKAVNKACKCRYCFGHRTTQNMCCSGCPLMSVCLTLQITSHPLHAHVQTGSNSQAMALGISTHACCCHVLDANTS